VVQELLPQDPRQVGRYPLLGRLGAGGMGLVFLGQSPGGRLVAVKLIRTELAADPDFRARFAREVDAARHVSGFFTAPVVDANLDGPQPWLVTAYVPGPSLADAVDWQGPLPAATVLALAAGLAEGLGAVHAAGVVHRDLKPSNVLLAADGPRIIDFGIARAVDATAVTLAGLVVGSPGFMSPEQAEGREAGPASDMFSLGSVLVFAATGEGPFGAGEPTMLLYRVVYGHATMAGVPAQIRPVVERCLAKDPQARPTTDQILAAVGPQRLAEGWLPPNLGQLLHGYAQPSLVPRPSGGSPPLRAPTERAGTPGRPADLAGEATVNLAGRDQPPRATTPFAQRMGDRLSSRRRSRRRGWAFGAGALAAVLAATGAVVALTSYGHRGVPRPTPPPTRTSVQPLTGITATLSAYFNAINTRNYRAAWSKLSPAFQASHPFPQFAAGESTTTVQDLTVHGIRQGARPGTYVAFVTFRSHQSPREAPNHTDTCDVWTLDYTMINKSGRWLISRAIPHPGIPEYQRC
jgi:serine/threonine protein kinase